MSKKPLVFISHKHSDHETAKALAVFVKQRSGGTIRVHLSSDPGFMGPRPGRQLNDELKQALAEAELLLLVYTSEAEDWSYCMWECGLATANDDHPTSVVVVQCTSDEPRLFLDQVRVEARNLPSVQKFVKTLLTTTEYFRGRKKPVTNFETEGTDVERIAIELHGVLAGTVKSGRVESEKEAYQALYTSLDVAKNVYSVTISAPDARIEERAAPVTEVRNSYFERKEELLASGELEEWLELFVGPEVPTELVKQRQDAGEGRYRARHVVSDGSLPVIAFSLIESRTSVTDGMMGWHSLVFGDGRRSGTFLRLSDKVVWNLQREYFELLWAAGQDVIVGGDD